MKTVVLTSTSSSSRTPSTTTRHPPDGRWDSSYFPGCRKDANCHCEMCLASIHATLDLIPSGSAYQQSTLTKLSASRPTARRALALADSDTPPPTPESAPPLSPYMQSTAKSRQPAMPMRKERSWVLGYRLVSLFAGLCLLWAADSGVLAVILRDFGPKLTPEAVKQFAAESPALSGELRVRLGSLQQKVEGVIGGRVLDCSSMDSNWELIQDGQIFFHWRCVIYQSVAEEVSIWGSPLRTSGLLPTGFSDRSLTLLSGRIIEWPKGRMVSTSRTSNSSSWTTQKWSLAVVQLEANTWVLEYQRSALFQSPGLIPAAMEVLRVRVVRMMEVLKQDPWRILQLPMFPHHGYHSSVENHFIHPT